MIAPTLGFLSFFAFFAWLALMNFGRAMAGMGDGISGGSKTYGVLEFTGALYLSLVFLSCLPIMRGKLLVATGIVAHVSLMFLAVVVLSAGFGGLIVLIPFFLFAAGWYALYKSRTHKH